MSIKMKKEAVFLSVFFLSVGVSGTTAFAVDGESTNIVVTVNEEEYYFSEAFSTADIPAGYTETTLTFNGEERAFVENDAGVLLGFLEDEDGNGSFFLYMEEDATFVPYTVISISDTTSIVLLSDTEGLSVSEDYVQGELTVNDLVYPYWVAEGDETCDIFYALNTTTGNTGFYRYDPADDTYQAYEMTESVSSSEETTETLLTKIAALVTEYTYLSLLAVAGCVILLLLLLLAVAVKLHRRNRELDYLYEEYHIPLYGEDDDSEDEESSGENETGDPERDGAEAESDSSEPASVGEKALEELAGAEKADKTGKSDKTKKTDPADKTDKTDRMTGTEKADKAEKAEKTEKAEKNIFHDLYEENEEEELDALIKKIEEGLSQKM